MPSRQEPVLHKSREKGLSDLQNLIQSGWKIFAQPAQPVGQKTLSSAF